VEGRNKEERESGTIPGALILHIPPRNNPRCWLFGRPEKAENLPLNEALDGIGADRAWVL